MTVTAKIKETYTVSFTGEKKEDVPALLQIGADYIRDNHVTLELIDIKYYSVVKSMLGFMVSGIPELTLTVSRSSIKK